MPSPTPAGVPVKNDVARIQSHELAKVTDDFFYAKHHVGSIPLLTHLTVDLRPYCKVLDVIYLITGDEVGADRSECVRGFTLGELAATLSLECAF